MKTIGKLMIAVLCVAFTGCGMADPWKKWEGEGEHSADRLLPSELKTALCAQEWWKASYEGKDYYFSFNENGKVNSSSSNNEKPVTAEYNIDWANDDEVILNFTSATHFKYSPASEETLIVTEFTDQKIVAYGKANRKAITLVPSSTTEYDAMEAVKLNYTLYTEFDSYTIPTTAGTLKVKVVGGDWNVVEPASDWLTFDKKDGEYAVFNYTARSHQFTADEVVFKQTTPEGEPLEHHIAVSSVSNVCKFDGGYAKVDFSGVDGNVLSYEALVYPEGFPNMINTVMGAEGQFLIRCGDANYDANKIQIATSNGNVDPGAGAVLPTNKWTHIAVTKSSTTICTYINGVKISEVAKTASPNISDFNLGMSWDTGRLWTGYMAEMRVWTKALTEEEINAPDHFYNVDPKSDGLLAYWKCDDGKGVILKDYANGHDCTGTWTGDSCWGSVPAACLLP